VPLLDVVFFEPELSAAALGAGSLGAGSSVESPLL
jgi:hypothetical protein